MKRIILLLDGTWNDADAGPADTNIVRLREIISRCLEHSPDRSRSDYITPDSNPSRTSVMAGAYKSPAAATTDPAIEQHLVYYERGVGTGGFLDLYLGGAFGTGLSRNIRRAYRVLSQNFEAGDQVFIFGFSRGSYTARSLCGYIGATGLLKKDFCTEENESRAWYYYRTSPPDRISDIADCLRRLSHKEVLISCLGVFDTVGALGVPLPAFSRENRDIFEFHDVGLSANARLNLQALAIDEHRLSFEPTLWRQLKFGGGMAQAEQVWFAGAHADIGGGYVDEELRQREDTPALDDLTLDWMLSRVLHTFPDFPVRTSGNQAWPRVSSKSAFAPQHEARNGFYRVLPLAWRSINNLPVAPRSREVNVGRDRHATPIGEGIHVSALERLGRLIHVDKRKSYYEPLNLVTALNSVEASFLTERPVAIVGDQGLPLDAAVATEVLRQARSRLHDI